MPGGWGQDSVASVRSCVCQKLPLCPTEPAPVSSKMELSHIGGVRGGLFSMGGLHSGAG